MAQHFLILKQVSIICRALLVQSHCMTDIEKTLPGPFIPLHHSNSEATINSWGGGSEPKWSLSGVIGVHICPLRLIGDYYNPLWNIELVWGV